MNIPDISTIKTAGEATDLAIEWQQWQGTQSLSWGECAGYGEYFLALAEKFNLTEEFKENAII